MKRGVDGLTEKQREILDAVLAHGNVSVASEKLGINKAVAYQRLYRLRNKFEVEKRFMETYNRYKIRIADKIGLYL